MSEHTSGPWELWTGCSYRRIGSAATGKEVCAPIYARDGHPDLFFPNGGQSGPDAKLLCAAPAMYQRLVLAQRLLLQGDKHGALEKIALGLDGDYDRAPAEGRQERT